MKTLVIAEAGVNHNGDVGLAKELIAAAAESGADIIKFQTFNASELVSKSAPKANYQLETTDPKESQYDMVRKLELSERDHIELIEYASEKQIEFFSTAFDFKSISLLERLGCLKRVKVPSGEITNLPLLEHLTRRGVPVLLSTGMATLGEVEEAINLIESSGTKRENITVLHCTTEYPTDVRDVNLRAMVNLGRALGVKYGYSDHTCGIETPLAAVALGASVIEKHFTISRSLPGPDHLASLEPVELTAMVKGIRNIELALGDGIKRPTASELKNRAVARKSIVASRHIKAGEQFTTDNLTTKRPGTGVTPMKWHRVLGQIATRDFAADELIEL